MMRKGLNWWIYLLVPVVLFSFYSNSLAFQREPIEGAGWHYPWKDMYSSWKPGPRGFDEKYFNQEVIEAYGWKAKAVDEIQELLPPFLYVVMKNPEAWGPRRINVTKYIEYEGTQWKKYLEATEKYKGQAKIDSDGWIRNYKAGCPFPNPKNGQELIWNFKKKFSEDDRILSVATIITNRSGQDRYQTSDGNLMYFDGRLEFDSKPLYDPNPHNYHRIDVYASAHPYEMQGTLSVIKQFNDPNKLEEFWLYLPALRRVRHLSAAQRTDRLPGGQDLMWEMFDVFNGNPVNYTCKMLGQKEMLVVHNGHPIGEWIENAHMACPNDYYQKVNVYINELTPKDSSFPFSKIILYSDPKTFFGYYGEWYDRKGRLYMATQFQYVPEKGTANPIPNMTHLDMQAIHSTSYCYTNPRMNHNLTPRYFNLLNLKKEYPAR